MSSASSCVRVNSFVLNMVTDTPVDGLPIYAEFEQQGNFFSRPHYVCLSLQIPSLNAEQFSISLRLPSLPCELTIWSLARSSVLDCKQMLSNFRRSCGTVSLIYLRDTLRALSSLKSSHALERGRCLCRWL